MALRKKLPGTWQFFYEVNILFAPARISNR